MTAQEIVRELRSGLPIHRHSPDPEPRLTPLSVTCVESVMREAADLIERLTAENTEVLTENDALRFKVNALTAVLEQVKRERDAAVEDINEMAEYVKDDCCSWCDQKNCKGCLPHNNFIWRGVQEGGAEDV